ncbi:MAG: DUF4417 domain-containing protein [Clostridiales bacterium]|nr:DUF4417 domain-containing protein [Clostridiales bacterium]
MSTINCTRNGCKDVFHAFLVKNANYDGELEIPCLNSEHQVPNRLIPFSKAIHSTDTDAWVHFYEDDAKFERIWNQPNKYFSILKKFNGVISPDFSVYRDMPLVMQQWNIYRSRALGHWLQENGICVIPNIRFGDSRTYDTACCGVEKHGVIAIGSHGCLKLLSERGYFQDGLRAVAAKLVPTTIIVYGTAPDYIFSEYKTLGIKIVQFDSDFMLSRKAVSA